MFLKIIYALNFLQASCNLQLLHNDDEKNYYYIVVVVSFYLSRFVALLRPISASLVSCKSFVLKFLQVGIWHFSFIIMHNN